MYFAKFMRGSFGVLAAALLFFSLAALAGASPLQRQEASKSPFVVLGSYFYNHGRADLAAMMFEKSSTMGNNAVAHHNLGVIYYEKGNLEMAEEEFTKAVEADAGYVTAHNSLALLLFYKGDFKGAISHFSKAVELSPANAQYRFDLGVSLGNEVRHGAGSIGELTGALEQFNQAEQLQPGYPNAKKNAKAVEQILQEHYELSQSIAGK